jgi:hypothetical protein
MNLMTPGVGQVGAISFTKALLDVITRLPHDKEHFTLTELHRKLLLRDTGLVQQPLYAALFESSHGGVVLQPLKRDLATAAPVVQHQDNDLVVRVSLSQPPTLTRRDEFLQWLTTARPSAVSRVSIEQTIREAMSREACGAYISEKNSGTEVSAGNRADLMAALQLL